VSGPAVLVESGQSLPIKHWGKSKTNARDNTSMPSSLHFNFPILLQRERWLERSGGPRHEKLPTTAVNINY
jgi:hypothetical protein